MIETSLKELENEALNIPERSHKIIVQNGESLQVANEFVHAVKKMINKTKEFFKPLKSKAKEAHQALVDKEKEIIMPLESSESAVKHEIGCYLAEQNRIRRDAEDRIRREEEERKRIEEEKLQKAIEAEDAGDKEEAEKIIDEVISEPEVKVDIPEPIKAEGTSIRTIWKWKVINEDLIPREYLIIDTARITRVVQSAKGQTRIAGIEAYPENIVAFRTK